MATRIQLRRATATQWTAANPVLAQGELGVETDAHRFKVGDGTTAWTALPYALDSLYILAAQKGAVNGVATLDSSGLIPEAQIPSVIESIRPKQSVVVVSSSNVTVSSPGAAIDGVTLNPGDRVLLVAQTAAAENGIYVFNGASSALTRAADANSSASLLNAFVFVNQGAQAQSGWENITPSPIVVGTTPQTWQQFEAPVSVAPTELLDANDNPAVLTQATASAINQVTVTNAAAGGKPKIAASGSDPNVALQVQSKGTGDIEMNNPLVIVNPQNLTDLQVQNTLNDANVKVVTTGANKAAFLSLFSTNPAFLAISGWVNNVLKWRIGRSGASAGVSVYTLDGATEAMRWDDSQNTRFYGGEWHHRVAVADVNYSALVNDYIIAYTSLTAQRTVTLPTAASVTGQTYIIKDEAGSAGTNNIVIGTTASQTIDGQATKTIRVNYGVVGLYSNGTNWVTVFSSRPPAVIFTAGGTYTVPSNVYEVEVTAVGAGGGGGGAGSALTSGGISNQAAGGGGGAGASAHGVFPVIPGAVLTVTIGTGGTAGSGGAANSNPGTAGGLGGISGVSGTGVAVYAKGGGGGGASAANSATAGTGGGTGGGTSTTVPGAGGPGSAASTGGTGFAGSGGGGGGAATATNGGGGGVGGGISGVTGGAAGGAAGASGTTAGIAGAVGVTSGGGGGGGGGGAPGGVGGAGGVGAGGLAIIRPVG